MAIVGRPPKPEAERRNQSKPRHDWQTVGDVPFANPPALPGRNGARVQRWWAAISTMPHCALWTPSDWQFAMDTAVVAQSFYRGNVKAAAELRQRELMMGTTMDARLKLRIKYTDPMPVEDKGERVLDFEAYKEAMA